jgi:hypothetical protein
MGSREAQQANTPAASVYLLPVVVTLLHQEEQGGDGGNLLCMKNPEPHAEDDSMKLSPEKEQLLAGVLAGDREAQLKVAMSCAAMLIERALRGDKRAERFLDQKLPGWRDADSEQSP